MRFFYHKFLSSGHNFLIFPPQKRLKRILANDIMCMGHGTKDAKGQRIETGVLSSPHRRHLLVQIFTVRINRLSTPQRAWGWSVLPREGGWSSGTVAGDGYRLHRRSWERFREPGIEMEGKHRKGGTTGAG